MKKAGVLVVVMALAGLVAAEATAQDIKPVKQNNEQTSALVQDSPAASHPLSVPKKEEVKVRIFKRQLPAPVQQVLMQDALAGWKLNEVYKISPDSAGQRTEYEIYFTNAKEQKGRIRVDEVGDIVINRQEAAALQDTVRQE